MLGRARTESIRVCNHCYKVVKEENKALQKDAAGDSSAQREPGIAEGISDQEFNKLWKWFGNLDQQQFTTVGDVTSADTWTTLKKTTKGVVKSTPELRNLLAALFIQYSDDGFVPGLNMRSGRVAAPTQPGDANPQAQTAGARPKKTIGKQKSHDWKKGARIGEAGHPGPTQKDTNEAEGDELKFPEER
eukprot:SAG31_NODE_4127_length_3559_cov_5.228324_1_plen_189_part_00